MVQTLPNVSTLDSRQFKLDWNPSTALTLGVECEVQLTDWKTQDLCPAAERVLALCQSPLVKNEIYQSMLELCTGICTNLREVEADLNAAKADLLQACGQLGIEPLGAATHPFAARQERILTAAPRYRMLLERNQWIARRMTIFGLHVHIGVPSADLAVHLMNGLMPYLAGLLALSASSPFWGGEDTGMASARATVFESQPAGGCPPSFENWRDFQDLCSCLQRSGSIVSLKDLWWDIRPNPGYGTVEIRICDGCASLDDVLGLTALMQCLAAQILEKVAAGQTPTAPANWRVRENKWRALRWGLEAHLIEDDMGTTSPALQQILNWLGQAEPYAQKLGCASQLQRVRDRLQKGSSSEQQRQIFKETGSLRGVVQALVAEWRDD